MINDRSPNPSARRPVMRIRTDSLGWKIILVFVLIAVCSAAADTISGAVRNQTTSKSAAGDTVILLRPAEGMREEAQTQSDAQGAFSFNVDATKNQHLGRPLH